MRKLFDDRLGSEPLVLRWIRRTLIAAAIVHFSLAAMAGYRAWVQVKSVQVQTQNESVGPGSTVVVDVVSSGRNRVFVSLDAVQDGQSHLLRVDTVPDNRHRFYDPRTVHRRFIVTLTPAMIRSLREGPIVLRATVRGQSQFLRVPPPVSGQKQTMISWRPVTEDVASDDNAAEDDTLCLASKIGLPCR